LSPRKKTAKRDVTSDLLSPQETRYLGQQGNQSNADVRDGRLWPFHVPVYAKGEAMTELIERPLPAGVTNPDAELIPRTVHLILTGQMIPNENAIYALARDWMRTHSTPQRDDL